MSYAEVDCSEKFPSGKSEYADLQLHGRASDFSTLSFIQHKTSQFSRGRTSTNISIDQQRQRAPSEEAMRSATGEEFFGEIPEASSSSVDARVKSRQNAVPSHGRSIRGQDNALCFQFMYDGQHSGPVLSDENNNNATPCSDGVSSEFYSANHSGVLPKATYSPHGSEIGGDFAVATSLESDNHGCRSLENYFESMQALRSVSDSAHDPKENGSKPAPDSTAKIFHREKRLSDETYICSRAGDKQSLFGKHTEFSGGFIESGHKTIQTALLSESREGDKNNEVKGKKNGEARHSLEGCNGGGVVDEAEILHPQANFRQRGFIHKLRHVEETRDSGLSHVNSMLISSEDQNGACSTEIDLSQELEDTGSDKIIGVPESPLKSFLSPEFMSPDHQSNLARRQSARSDFGGDMQSLPHNADANGSPDGSTSSGDALHHEQDIADGMGQGKSTADGNFHAENGSNDDWRKTAGSREGNASKSRENNSSQVRQENGESPACEEDSSLGKHIYPWMKESRQNARRKQSSSSNSSGSADKSSKRERTAYTNSQLVELEKEFHFNRYLCRPRRIEMAQMLNLTERQIKIWFQNRRMKYKKDQKLKTMPMSSLGRDGSFYHHQHHHHPQNMNSEALFSRNNDHRHYSHGGHVHSAETPYRQVPDGSSSAHGGLDCSSGGRCYHGHRPLGGHISQDSSSLIQQPLARTASNSYDGMNKTYSASNHKANSGGRLTSPSSSSSTGTLSPGNGRSSGGFGSEIAMRSTPSTGSEVQTMVQPGCGFLAHAVSPNAPNNGIDDESPVLREKNTSGVEGRRLVNHPAYDMSFTGHGFSPFQRRMDDIAARMPFGNAATGIGQQISAMSNHYFGGYDRQKDPAALAMIVDPSTSVQQNVSGNSRYSQFHNPLDSLTDCVQRSRDFPHQTPNVGRYPHADAYAASFTAGNTNSFDRNRYERSLETSPLDFSNRSKSSSPRTQHSEVYIHNRLTHL